MAFTYGTESRDRHEHVPAHRTPTRRGAWTGAFTGTRGRTGTDSRAQDGAAGQAEGWAVLVLSRFLSTHTSAPTASLRRPWAEATGDVTAAALTGIAPAHPLPASPRTSKHRPTHPGTFPPYSPASRTPNSLSPDTWTPSHRRLAAAGGLTLLPGS